MLGRYGELGTVVGMELAPGEIDGPALVVRGGVSERLVYLVPSRRIVGVSDENCTVTADADVADFVPLLSDDGTLVLRLDR
ncbi:MAG: hypothetical protein OEW52_02910 [Thermoleophilia bacterium]|nr:hypothetical protein [Thermoleophilia bacterium]MDH5280084.1 hypothetical protein [Thermoleophilia bacterium]